MNLVFEWSHVGCVHSGLDLPIGYVGLSLWPQDPKGPPENCGTHRGNCLGHSDIEANEALASVNFL